MSVALTINGVIFNYPQNFDTGWGVDATGWAQAVTSGMLQKSGGSFPLTAEVDFGSSFGLKPIYLKTHSANPAASGTIRLSSSDAGIGFRNNANSGDLILTTDASDNLVWGSNFLLQNTNALKLQDSGNAHTIALHSPSLATNYSFVFPPNAGSNGQVLQTDGAGTTTWVNATGTGTVGSGVQYQLAVYATTGNTVTGMTNPMTGGQALITDGNGVPTTAGNGGTTGTEIGYVHGVTSSIQSQLNGKVSKAGDTMSGVLDMGSHKITSLANGTAATDAAAFGQIPTNLPPTGSITMYGGASAPTGWLLCDGTSYATATYPALFAVIGYTFGGGGANFNVPNMANNVPVGSGSIAALGATAGSQTHSITTAEMPSHTHSVNDPSHGHELLGVNLNAADNSVCLDPATNASGVDGGSTHGNTTAYFPNNAFGTPWILSNLTGITLNNTGSGTAMSLVQPVLGVTFIIKT